MNDEEQRIIDILRSGQYIRIIDGRYRDGYVDTNMLDEMVKCKEVKVEELNCTKFATGLRS